MDREARELISNLRSRLSKLGGFFDLDSRREKINKLEQQSATPGFWDSPENAQGVMRELSSHKKWVEDFARLDRELNDLVELAELAADTPEETSEIQTALNEYAHALDKFELATYLSGEDDARNAIMTIHPGAGGTESQDWAEMLFRMYNRWAEQQGFTVSLIDYQAGEEAGLKSATMIIKGEYVYGYLKAESGVHRLVRISPFDANSRRHTSFASVFVSPEIEDSIVIDIKDEDLRIDTYRASGAGGQHVNKTSSAVRITHIPSGIVVQCQTERSQFKNKDSAMRVLRSRLYQQAREQQHKDMEKYESAKKKIEWGSQIRSYVFHPYTMVKDHRTGAQTSDIQRVMNGDLEMFINAFITSGQVEA
ncbi:MAG: peptide chain release factor 2 [candidate division Zixibacteria bacterium]|nr:peptide chain release factor 2 [candidate division Zixibacteria bacterium]